MRYIQTDGGRQFSKRPMQRNDCTVIAVAVACNLTYDEAYDALKDAGRRSNRAFLFPTARNLSGHVGDFWFGFWEPRGKDTLGQFTKRNPKGAFLIGVPDHIFAVKNGIVWDSYDERWLESTEVREVWSIARIPYLAA